MELKVIVTESEKVTAVSPVESFHTLHNILRAAGFRTYLDNGVHGKQSTYVSMRDEARQIDITLILE